MGSNYAGRICADAIGKHAGHHLVFWRVVYSIAKYGKSFIGRMDKRTNMGNWMAIKQIIIFCCFTDLDPLDIPPIEGRPIDGSGVEVPNTYGVGIGISFRCMEITNDILT